MSKPRHRGFTIVELLVVVSVILILVSLMLPNIQMSREAALAAQCNANLHNIGIAYHNFRGQHTNKETQELPNTWTDALLPYLQEDRSILVCPKDPDAIGYAAVHGDQGTSDGSSGTGSTGTTDPGGAGNAGPNPGAGGNGGNDAAGGGNGAVVPEGGGDVKFKGNAPPNLRLHKVEHKNKIFVYQERENYELPGSVRVQVSSEGMYNGAITGPSPKTIPAGTVVDVYLLHWDPKGKRGQTKGGKASFPSEILGAIVTKNALNSSDRHGAQKTRYYKGKYRGMESNADTITISYDRKTITVNHFWTPGWMEEVRVFTKAAQPEEPTYETGQEEEYTETGGTPGTETDPSGGDGAPHPVHNPSYAMNSLAFKNAALRVRQFLMMEYHGKTVADLETEIENGTLDQLLLDPSRPLGRHFGKLHVLFMDGSVELMSPHKAFDPESDHWKSRLTD